MRHAPSDLPTGTRLQRVEGTGLIHVKHDGTASRLSRLHQEGAAKIRLPHRTSPALEAILINTAGGLTGGDRISWSVEADAGASVVVTTQACEKLYRASYGHAEATCSIKAGAGAHVAWLPQETIAYNGSAFSRRLDVDLHGDASAMILEATMFGRKAMGEAVTHARFRDRWRVRCDGRLIHAEHFCIGPDVAHQLERTAVTGGGAAVATLLMVGADCEERLDAVRDVIGDAGSASAWSVSGTGKLLARLVAVDSYSLRARLVPLLMMLNGQAGLPKTWSI
jgi:urease accessory protein